MSLSTNTAELKAWTTARAIACRAGVIAGRTDLVDGPRLYFTVHRGVPRQHADLAALEAYVGTLQALEGRH